MLSMLLVAVETHKLCASQTTTMFGLGVMEITESLVGVAAMDARCPQLWTLCLEWV